MKPSMKKVAGDTKMKRSRKTALFVLAGILAVVAILFLLHGPPQLLAKSESPDFCSQCHVMESQYEAWMHQGAHRRQRCVDCHLPNENAAVHYVWKSIDGMKDVLYFYSGMVPEHITLSSHGEKVVTTNCIRCHESAVTMISQERKCWECHRRIMHKLSGSIETI